MIREEISELFVRANSLEKKFSIKIEDLEKLTNDALKILQELKENYYLIPKENIDSNIKFATTDNEINDNSVKNYLKSELIRALEMKNVR